MKQLTAILLVLAIWFFAGERCKKPGSPVTSGGGKGGTGKITITPEFANFLIDTFTAYIKYGTHDAPANGIYDDSAQVAVVNGIPVATFDSLKVGIYYFYGIGYHTDPSHPPNLKGSQIATLTTEDSTHLYLPMDPYFP